MNERNQELIVDLIGGRLSPDEEHAALTRIESDPGLRAEYEAQMSAISLLGASPPPTMTAKERTALHTALRRQLNLNDAPVPVVAAPSRWQRWRAPIGGLAVAAAVVFGAVVVLPGALSEDDSIETFEAAAAPVTTTAPSESLAEDSTLTAEDEGTGDSNAGAAAPEATGSAPEDAASADAETQAAETYDAVVGAALPYLTDLDLDMLSSELASDPDSVRNSAPPPPAKSAGLDAGLVDACLESLRADSPTWEVSPVALTTYEDTESVVVSITPSGGDGFLAVYGVALCQELANTQG